MHIRLNWQVSQIEVDRRTRQFKLALDNAKNVRLCLRTCWQ